MNLLTWKDRRVFRFLCLLTVAVAAVTALPVRALVEKRTLRDLIDESEHVVVATCVGQSSHLDATGARVFTVSRFDVQTNILGEPPLEDLSIRVLGGQRGEMNVTVPGAPRFVQGQKYLLFVTPEFENGFRTTVGWKQGVMEVTRPSSREPETVIASPGIVRVYDQEVRQVRQQDKPHISGLTLDEVISLITAATGKSGAARPAAAAAKPETDTGKPKRK
ncbi:MAG: hypothetical protein KIT79_00070 [Deltaproteobacteria bacterium]|nr:hypothetical protein [Deltaproteobacteria bacterium]